jgi:methylenetetrahydrofolate dehydrogenase (NADP+)/methenyltetrahydrofolate cyclohydrolase
MGAQILDGKTISEQFLVDVKSAVSRLNAQGIPLCLAVVLVGNNPASQSYVKAKRKALAEVGISDRSIMFPENVSETLLLETIRTLNDDPAVNGILVQLPLPPQIDSRKVIETISPAKDVDGFTATNIADMFYGDECFLPCTPQGICELLRKADIQTDGANVVIIGRSTIVGKPLALLLMRKEFNATVTVCHSGTKHLGEITKSADILVVASGHPGTVTKDMVKPGSVVIDVGVNRIPDASRQSGYRLCGDVDYEAVRTVAGYITPVPGGVGPMTIAMLMHNTVVAGCRQHGLPDELILSKGGTNNIIA